MESELSPQQKIPVCDEVVRVERLLENKGLKEEEDTKRKKKEREEKIEICWVEQKERQEEEELILSVWEEDIKHQSGRR